LAVSTAPNDGGEPTVTGFEWLGSAGETYNPMGIPAEILQKVQEYATDKVIPVYAMTSLIGQYNQGLTLPSAEDVLEDAELHYLRVSVDGNTVTLDAEGHGIEGTVRGEDFSLLDDVSALFDGSVRVKAYYPIMTSREGGAVYFRTSIGDYILYLHGEMLTASSEGAETPADTAVPYLVPTTKFHIFSYGMADKGDSMGIGWDFNEGRMAVIEPYRIGSETYQKPVNIATPEAAEQIKVGERVTSLTDTLGICLGCAGSRALYYDKKSGEYILPTPLPLGLHYWELTDGSGLVIYADTVTTVPNPSQSSSLLINFYVAYKERVDAAVLDDMGTPTLRTCALITEGMERYVVHAILGEPLAYNWSEENSNFIWKWMEDGQAHTLRVYWSGGYSDPDLSVTSVEYSAMTVTEAVKEIQIGSSFADIVARLGPCRDGHKVDSFGGTSKSGYHFWTLPDGRCLAAYIGYDIPALTDPLGLNSEYHFNKTVMHLLYPDSPDHASTIGTPGLSMAAEVQTGMKEELVKALMGEPTVTVEGLQSVWEWSEGGKTYILTVYWKDNAPVGFHRNFNTVSRYELDAETSSAPLIPDKIPTLANAQVITEGMTASELITIMGSNADAVTGVGYTYYIWTLSDGQAFCAVTEDDVMNADQSERIVTYTYFRDSVEKMAIPTVQNVEAVTEGMSIATVRALLGGEHIYPEKISEKSYTWYTPEDAWWEITITFETVKYSETNRSQAYVFSVYIDKGI
jgi:outer membrane protein assembly factor BamE (lipoprotein component of BamABCDE complex)